MKPASFFALLLASSALMITLLNIGSQVSINESPNSRRTESAQKQFFATKNRIEPLVTGNPQISEFANSMAIVEIIGGKSRENYQTAIDSVECYASMKGYYMYFLKTEDFFRECGHYQDFFYRRHCVVHVLMEATSHHWYAFLDSDMEVISINGSFQNYVGPNFDVYLYDRIWNWEIMAGSYIVRGNQFGRDFVRGFADYEFRHPRVTGHHGTDNGAIQFFVAELALGRTTLAHCWHLWETAMGWDDMFLHEWCVRKKLGARSDFGRIKIYSKGRGWARDGGLTSGRFSPEVDFILHARKEEAKLPFNASNLDAYWYETRTVPLDMAACRAGTQQWVYRDNLVITPDALRANLGRSAAGVFPFLEGVHSRLNKSTDYEFDKIHHSDVIGWFATFPFDPQWNKDQQAARNHTWQL